MSVKLCVGSDGCQMIRSLKVEVFVLLYVNYKLYEKMKLQLL